MSLYNPVKEMTRQVRQRDKLIAGLFVLIMLSFAFNFYLAKTIHVQVTPGIKSASVVQRNNKPDINVYALASEVFQQLNYWKKNGREDYAQQQKMYSMYFTSKFRRWLKHDFQNKRGRLNNKVRQLLLIPGVIFSPKRVEKKNDHWIVWLDYQLKETINGVTINDAYLRWGIRVVNASSAANPWGLQIDGIVGGRPQPIPGKELIKMGLKDDEK